MNCDRCLIPSNNYNSDTVNNVLLKHYFPARRDQPVHPNNETRPRYTRWQVPAVQDGIFSYQVKTKSIAWFDDLKTLVYRKFKTEVFGRFFFFFFFFAFVHLFAIYKHRS